MLDYLRTWIASASGLPAIWANQNVPRPDRPYVTLQILSVQAVGQDEQRGVVTTHHDDGPDTDDQETIGVRHATIRASLWGDDNAGDPRVSMTGMSDLRDRLRTESARDDLWQHDVSILDDPQVLDVPQTTQSRIQPQAVLELTVGFRVKTLTEMAWIEHVAGSVTVAGRASEITEPFEFDVGG